jgi:hypothetical protein
MTAKHMTMERAEMLRKWSCVFLYGENGSIRHRNTICRRSYLDIRSYLCNTTHVGRILPPDYSEIIARIGQISKRETGT